MCLTSCEGALDDVLGEWSRPTPGNNTNTTPSTDMANKYLVYSYDTTNGLKSTPTQIPSDALDAADLTTTISAGTYVVKSNIDVTGDYTFTGDVNLILLDNTTFKITGTLTSATWGDHKLNIYAQSTGDEKGKLIINSSTTGALCISCGDISIHGGDITATCSASNSMGIETRYDLNIYSGKVTAHGAMEGLNAYQNLNIYGGTIVASNTDGGNPAINCGNDLLICGAETDVTATGDTGPGTGSYGGIGISTINMTIDGAKVTATGGDGGTGDNGGDAIACLDNSTFPATNGTLTFKGGSLIASGGAAGSGGGTADGYAVRGNMVVATGFTFYEATTANPSTSAPGSAVAGDGGTPITSTLRYIEVK